MKRLVVFLVIVVLLFAVTACGLAASAADENTKDDLYLVLVNKNHRLPVDWLERIELVTAYNFQGEEFQVEKVTLEHFEALRDELLLE